MNASTEITLDGLHQSIVDAIKLQFPDFATVEDYYQDRERLTLPACLIDMTSLEPSQEDPGTEQLAVEASFDAYLIIGFKTNNAKREIRKLAASFGAFVHMSRFGQPIGPAQVVDIAPDEFDPEMDKYEVWRVEWKNMIHLGTSVWKNDGTIPTTVLSSFAPSTGSDNEADYVEVQLNE